jgi:pimeloyl-ACP methyl ester carboxylesterase
MGPRQSDARKISRFRNAAGRCTFLTAYDNALATWPVPPAQLDVETRYGPTHVHSCGASSGTPVVLLHGVGASSPSWFASVASLGKDRPVFAVDTITDAGRSIQKARIRNGSDLALWLDDVLTHLGSAGFESDRVHLVGLSYGGWLALNQALRSPERLASITSVEPPGAIAKMKFNVKMLPDGVLAKFAHSDAALHRLLRMLNNGAALPQPTVDLATAWFRTFVPKQPFPGRLNDEELRSIRTPTLLLFGERSLVTDPARAVERARRLIANVEAEIVGDAGHMLPVEKPDVFNSRLLTFIDSLDRR